MLVYDFDYQLPPESIAQEPLAERAASRLLHLVREGTPRNEFPANMSRAALSRPPFSRPLWQDCWFREFPDLLQPDDLLVLNSTRVFPARLHGYRSGERAQPLSPHNPASRDFLRGRVEVLLTRQLSEDPNEWECLVRPGRKIGVGEKLFFREVRSGNLRPGAPESGTTVELEAEVTARGSFGERRIRFAPVADFFEVIERIGHVPLPPYIDRDDRPSDRDRYQTVYARARGSVAAPTAGLHFTPEILDRIRVRGIEIAEITLHVGLGTFQPLRVEKVEDHKLHREHFEIPPAAATAINKAKTESRRVVAIGTTTVRTLEFAAQQTGGGSARVEPGAGEADLFIYPGYRFRIVEALLTNFHLPQSTLLMLVCALAGRDLVLAAYRHAVEAGYRFYSYGDCMFIE
jgi:S-adenosylmethionine:tRNA ribosyltransferase-isomerase